jgi:hypothetical protein
MSENKKNQCTTCKTKIGPDGHLCIPITKKDESCDWCGSMIVNQRHLCNDKVKDLAYICNSCGRTAVQAQHLCQPTKIK